MNQFKLRRKIDISIPTVGIILSLFGLVMVLSASQILAGERGSPYYYFIRQLISWFIGMGAFFYFLRTPLEKLYHQRSTYLIVTIVLLAGVLVFGPKIAAVRRWFDLGFFRFQPAEFAKLFLVIYFAGWFAAKGDAIRTIRQGLLPFVAVLGTIVLLIILEPDMGTALVIIFLSMTTFFVARANLLQYFSLIVVGVLALVLLIYAAPYRAQRFTSFLQKNNSSDTLGASYHSQQAIIAVGSGGWWGVGFGQGTSKYSYLPQAYTDSIFAVIGEELGFIRSSLLILAYFYLAWRGFLISQRANSRFVQLIATGVATAIIVQALINIGGMLQLLPLTGVPLPFISYGGSSLIVSLAMIGLLTNASREVDA